MIARLRRSRHLDPPNVAEDDVGECTKQSHGAHKYERIDERSRGANDETGHKRRDDAREIGHEIEHAARQARVLLRVYCFGAMSEISVQPSPTMPWPKKAIDKMAMASPMT
jgi:hypothetical protein